MPDPEWLFFLWEIFGPCLLAILIPGLALLSAPLIIFAMIVWEIFKKP